MVRHRRHRPRPAAARRRPGRDGRHPRPQRPGVRAERRRRRQARRRRRLPEHRVRRAAARRRRRPRGHRHDPPRRRVRRRSSTGAGRRTTVSGSELATLAEQRSPVPFPPTRHIGRQVILTSGTTGRPKGAARGSGGSLGSLTPLLEVVPIRARSTVVIAAPLFHAWGLVHMGVGLGMSSTAVVQSQFDPEATLAADRRAPRRRARGRAGDAAAHPRPRRRDARPLRHVVAALHRVQRVGARGDAGDGDAAALRADPLQHLRLDRGLAGHDRRPRRPPGRAVDGRQGRPGQHGADPRRRRPSRSPTGAVGRVFVGSGARFDGYTGGGGKEQIDGLLSSGDLGHFDADGRLFIDGRDDDMIVSGGENVFPAEVEDLLATHPAVLEAAVIGVPDEEFGQRLKAFVVQASGGDADPGGRQGARAGSPCAVQGPAYGGVRGRPPAHDDRQAPAPRPPVTAAACRRATRADPAGVPGHGRGHAVGGGVGCRRDGARHEPGGRGDDGRRHPRRGAGPVAAPRRAPAARRGRSTTTTAAPGRRS